jgi:hypothetical protein
MPPARGKRTATMAARVRRTKSPAVWSTTDETLPDGVEVVRTYGG